MPRFVDEVLDEFNKKYWKKYGQNSTGSMKSTNSNDSTQFWFEKVEPRLPVWYPDCRPSGKIVYFPHKKLKKKNISSKSSTDKLLRKTLLHRIVKCPNLFIDTINEQLKKYSSNSEKYKKMGELHCWLSAIIEETNGTILNVELKNLILERWWTVLNQKLKNCELEKKNWLLKKLSAGRNNAPHGHIFIPLLDSKILLNICFEGFSKKKKSMSELDKALSRKSNLKCMGHDCSKIFKFRQAAYRELEKRYQTKIQMAAGAGHLLILFPGGKKVMSLGLNDYNQLGKKYMNSYLKSNLLPQEIAFFNGERVTEVAAGYSHSLFLTEEGNVFACGNQQGYFRFYNKPKHNTAKFYGQCSQINSKNKEVKDILCVGDYSCIYYEDDLKSYGRFQKTETIWQFRVLQLGTINLSKFIEKLRSTGWNGPSINNIDINPDYPKNQNGYIVYGVKNVMCLMRGKKKEDRDNVLIFRSASKKYSVLQIGDIKVKQMACGRDHFLILTQNGEVYRFGNNKFGQLGRKTEKEDDMLPDKINFKGKKAISIACGTYSSWILLEDLCLKGFGVLAKVAEENVTEISVLDRREITDYSRKLDPTKFNLKIAVNTWGSKK